MANEGKAQAGAALEEKFALTSSRHFPSWLASSGGSIAFTTYQAGKLFLLGVMLAYLPSMIVLAALLWRVPTEAELPSI